MGVLVYEFPGRKHRIFSITCAGGQKKKKALAAYIESKQKYIHVRGFVCFHGIQGLKSCFVPSANLWLDSMDLDVMWTGL